MASYKFCSSVFIVTKDASIAMNMELLSEVIAFVAEYWEEPKSQLSAETSINTDLGMDGDDGFEFMQAFSRRFAVDLRAFPYDNYFGNEAAATSISIITMIIRWFATGKATKLSPLTVGQLAMAVENGSWVVHHHAPRTSD